MKSVYIISYFYPPCTLTASQRPEKWASELSKSGFKVTVITRKWEREVKVYEDECFPTSEGVSIEEKDNIKVIRTPYQANLRDRIYVKYGNSRFAAFRKFLTVVSLFLRNLHPSFSPYKNLYYQFIEEHKTNPADIVLISGNPFNPFYFGYLFNKKFGVKWVADYRDAWTTTQIEINQNIIFKILRYYNRYFEKKWCSSAAMISSVSEPIASKIGRLTNRPYLNLPNGYKDHLFSDIGFPEKFNDFTITYVGTLYNEQNIELFLGAYKEFLSKYDIKDSVFLLPGIELYADQKNRILDFDVNLRSCIRTTSRLKQMEVLEIQRKSHLLLYVGWKGFEGVIPSKIYEYCASGTPVIVVPADDSEVDKIVKSSQTGHSISNKEEVIDVLYSFYTLYQKGNYPSNDVNSHAIKRYSSSQIVKELAAKINELLN